MDFLTSLTSKHVLKGIVVQDSYAWCLQASGVDNLDVTNSIFTGCMEKGVAFIKTKNYKFDSNIIVDVKRNMAIQKKTETAGIDVSKCEATTPVLSNNIASGIWGPGFVNPGYDCSQPANLVAYKT